jgi:hypothetical protein
VIEVWLLGVLILAAAVLLIVGAVAQAYSNWQARRIVREDVVGERLKIGPYSYNMDDDGRVTYLEDE